jgi:predicted metalloprotease with PDZ domain
MITRYRIAILDAHAHLFEVACTVADPDPAGQRFRLPSWIPGSYLIREFSRHFVRVCAESRGAPVAIVKEAKDLWRAAPCAGPLTVVAHVYAFDPSVRGAYLDASRAYFNGAVVFLCPEGHAHRPCELLLEEPDREPDSDEARRWRVATTLARAGAPEFGFGVYRAADYDELIDHPVEVSDFALMTFEAGGARHDIAVTGRVDADLDRLARDLRRVCQWQIDLFGGGAPCKAPFDRYLFQIAAVGEGYGGLEHRSSTSLVCRRDCLPATNAAKIDDDYLSFLSLASHEYFHSWNVKRIKPSAFVPYELDRERYTRLLWAFEGITSYYDDLALVRSGVVEPARYLELLGRAITTLLRTPGRKLQSLAESSFDAWIKYYRADENTPNAVVSYYVKGSLAALALDLKLRLGGSSLDALMRTLWQRYGAAGAGVPENGVRAIAIELGGLDVEAFFARYVDGTEDPPFAELLERFGVTFHMRAAKDEDDRGGKPPKESIDEANPACWLGAKLAKGGAETRLAHVYSSGPAERAGLAGGDVLVAIGGLRASPAAIRKIMQRRRAGEMLTVHAFRRDELFATTLTLDEAPKDTCWLALSAAIGDDVRQRRDAWLGIVAPAKE